MVRLCDGWISEGQNLEIVPVEWVDGNPSKQLMWIKCFDEMLTRFFKMVRKREEKELAPIVRKQYMVANMRNIPRCELRIRYVKIKQGQQFKYLETKNVAQKSEGELKSRKMPSKS